MHTHKEALIILNCSKMTLSRYVKNGKLERVKKGTRTYYDEHQVAALVKEIEDNKNKYRPDVPKKEKQRIELPDEIKRVYKNVSSSDCLSEVGYEYLADATQDIKRLGLYEDVDKQILVLYALSCQNYFKYLKLATEADCITVGESGNIAVHPYFKVMQHHEKQMLAYMDRLGLNPLSRIKFEIKEEEEVLDSIFDEKPKSKEKIL